MSLESLEREIQELRDSIAHLPIRLAAPGSSAAVDTKRAQLTTAFSQGTWATLTSATATLYAPASAVAAAAWVVSAQTITVYDNGFVPEDGLVSGTKIQVKKLNGQWYYDGGC